MATGLAFAIALAILPAHTLPNPALTPGVADPALTAAVLCDPHFTTRTVRHVPAAEKRAVYRAYGMVPRRGACAPKGCEIDHLISLEIGGSNAVANLWPEPYAGPWNAHIKDKLENRLHRLVCRGAMTLPAAQAAIAGNWVVTYQQIFGAAP